jgi:sugar lactone lactonase YvrE
MKGFGGDNGPATSASLNLQEYGAGVVVDSSGNLYIADSGNYRIRKVSAGVITTVAGSGAPGFAGDSEAAVGAELNLPQGIAVDTAGNLYIADYGNQRVRKVSGGTIATVAGNGAHGSGGNNGPATGAELYRPSGVALDGAGNLYIADTINNCVRKVAGGVVTTVAGNGTQGFSGDDGPAALAQLSQPYGVAVDSAGNLYIADSLNNRIREVSGGVITTVAGNGSDITGGGDNGSALSAVLAGPRAVAVDAGANLYIKRGRMPRSH